MLATQTLAAAQAEVDAHPLRRRARQRRHGEGPDPRARSARWASTAPSATSSSTRRGDRGAVDGRPDDDVQHDDRGRRPRGHDRSRRDDVRLGRGRPGAPGTSRRLSSTGATCTPTRARRSTARSTSTRARSRPLVTWGTKPGQVVPSATPCPSRAPRPTSARWMYMALRPARRWPRSSSTACSSARAPTPASATCAPPPAVIAGRRSPTRQRDGRTGLPAGRARRPRTRDSTRSSRAAGLDWRKAGCWMCLGMNPDVFAAGRALRLDLEPQLEGRQGRGGARTWSPPQMAAAAADRRPFVDIREWDCDGTDPGHQGSRHLARAG